MAKIPEGCILLARKIRDSEIWYNKPSWWLKVWCYILMQVNHKDNKEFKRGQNFFSYLQIFNDCKLNIDRVKAKSVDNVVRWLRATTQITTKLTTRGIVITVCNYEVYQNLNSYKNDNTKDTVNDDGTTTERRRNDTINKYVKNEKNVSKENIQKKVDIPFEEIINYLNSKIGSDYKAASSLTQEKIRARWSEGFKLQDFQTVIDNKADWIGTEHEKYLRPETLFGRKFEGYLNEKRVQKKDRKWDGNKFV